MRIFVINATFVSGTLPRRYLSGIKWSFIVSHSLASSVAPHCWVEWHSLAGWALCSRRPSDNPTAADSGSLKGDQENQGTHPSHHHSHCLTYHWTHTRVLLQILGRCLRAPKYMFAAIVIIIYDYYYYYLDCFHPPWLFDLIVHNGPIFIHRLVPSSHTNCILPQKNKRKNTTELPFSVLGQFQSQGQHWPWGLGKNPPFTNPSARYPFTLQIYTWTSPAPGVTAA